MKLRAGLGRLLHDIAELAGQDQPVLAFMAVASTKQDVAAELSPGQAGDHPRGGGAHLAFPR